MEYATREQAQNAVNTLSNQNLMGRLVYVREVCHELLGCRSELTICRTVKPSPVSSVDLPVVSSGVAAVVSAVAMAAVPAVVVVVADSSMCRTFVLPIPPCAEFCGLLLTCYSSLSTLAGKT